MALAAGNPSARARRLEASIAVTLAVLIFVVGNRLLERAHLPRADWSEDQIASLSGATPKILERLEGSVQIEAFFTSDLEHGGVALMASRLVDQLSELERLSNGNVQVVYSDPGRSSEALLRARDANLTPVPIQDVSGTQRREQLVYFGLVCRHRGAVRTLPLVVPQTLEFSLLSALDDLSRARRKVIGWLADESRSAEFRTARELLSLRYDVRTLTGLAEGLPIPDDVDLVLCAAPRELAPRAAFAIERFALGGGAVMIAADRSVVDAASRSVASVATGLERLLASWGLRVTEEIVWDRRFATRLNLVGAERVSYPPYLLLRPDPNDADAQAFQPEHPLTVRATELLLRFAHALEAVPSDHRPATTWLLRSSDQSWLLPLPPRVDLDPDTIALQQAQLMAAGGAGRSTLAVALTGVLPGWTPNNRVPLPRDPLRDKDAIETGTAGGFDGTEAFDPNPPAPIDPQPTKALIFGDADWLTPVNPGSVELPPFNRAMLENAVDWLMASPELIALRSKSPTPRPIRDFLREELERTEREGDSPLLAERRASRRRWLHMGAALGGSLALLSGAVLLVRTSARRPRLHAESSTGDDQ